MTIIGFVYNYLIVSAFFAGWLFGMNGTDAYKLKGRTLLLAMVAVAVIWPALTAVGVYRGIRDIRRMRSGSTIDKR